MSFKSAEALLNTLLTWRPRARAILGDPLQVPNEWQEDRRWREPGGAGLRSGPTHKASIPSRWIPVPSALQRPDPDREDSEGTDIKIVDRFVVPKKRCS